MRGISTAHEELSKDPTIDQKSFSYNVRLNRRISARALHGDKSQGARQAALKEFKEYKIAALVATDIAARGLDISELPLVINFDLPNIPETYVHRIGRTGRAGMEGTALSFCAEDERPYLKDIEKLIRIKIPELGWPEGMPVEEKTPIEAELPLHAGRNADYTENRKQKQKKAEASAEEASTAKTKKKAAPKTRRSAPTEALAAKYPKSAPKSGGRDSRRRRNSLDDLSMDISTPRVHELSEEAAARVRAKVMAKLAERAATHQKATEKPKTEEKPVRRRTARVSRRRSPRPPK